MDYSCDCISTSGGNFYNECDLMPYEEPFVLPEKWCIKLTNDNIEVVGKYYNQQCNTTCYADYNNIEEYLLSHDWVKNTPVVKGNCPANIRSRDIPKGFIEITFKQFQEHILKQDTMCKRFKTKEEFEQEFGNGWENNIHGEWASSMNYLFGQYQDEVDTKSWIISEDMLTTNPLPTKETLPKGTMFSIGDIKYMTTINVDEENYTKKPISRSTHKRTFMSFGEVVINGETWVAAEGANYTGNNYYLFKLTDIMNKKIIGYQCTMNLYGKHSPKGTVWVQTVAKTYTIKDSDSSFILPAEIVEQWKPVYESQEKTIQVSDFSVVVKPNGIFHKSDDITKFVEELVKYFDKTGKDFGGYLTSVKDVTFSKTGCQQVSTLSEWKIVWQEYLKFKE